MLRDVEVKLGIDYLADKEKWDSMAEHVIYTGPIDAYFHYALGPLEYRSVRFETEVLDQPNFQENCMTITMHPAYFQDLNRTANCGC